MRLILASASPRRAELLRAAGYSFDTVTVDVDERPRERELPAGYVRRLAAEKSAMADLKVRTTTEAAQPPSPGFGEPRRSSPDVTASGGGAFRPAVASDDAIILAADTAVVVDGEILGKPRDDEDAERMLRRLSGRQHEVMTGISLRGGAHELGCVITTVVWFAALSDRDISWYLASEEGRDKAGAYAIQGLASRFIPQITGSYTNVVGLPVAAVHELLQQMRFA